MKRIPTSILIILSLAFMALIAGVVTASAEEDSRWVWRIIRKQYCSEWSGCEWRYAHVRVYRPPVYAYERRDDDDRRGWDCRDIRRAVGDQHLTIDGAKNAANEAWAGTIRFHLGEKFMDLKNARHIEYTCSRSSIKEQGASVTTLGQALSRCEIEAQPCQPGKEHEHRDGRR